MMTAHNLKPAHSLHSLLEGLAAELPNKDIAIEGLCLDSRSCQRGSLFMACAGSQSHGLAHAVDAKKHGAAAIAYETDSSLREWPGLDALLETLRKDTTCINVDHLQQKVGIIADRFYSHPSEQQFVVGITGTNGKTSCGQFIAEALSERETCGVLGTLGNGVFGDLQATTHTTPDAVSVQRILAEMKQQDVKCISMEVSSHGLMQGRVNGVAFDVAVLTNLSRDHLDYHDDMESYAMAKRRLFEMPGLRYAVINVDDEFGRRLLKTMPGTVQTVAYSARGISEETEEAMVAGSVMHLGCVCAEKLQLTHEGMSIRVSTPWGDGEIHSHLLGRFNASNLLAVLSVLLIKGIRVPDALDMINKLHTVPGRMQRYAGKAGKPLVVVDYAHTPDAIDEVLLALRDHCQGKLWCVFGCGGDRDRGKRPLMGAAAERVADHLVITDDNPRSESAQAITDDILTGLQNPDHAVLEHDRAAAIRYALQRAGEFDIVLVAGKGHEDYQITGNQRLHFSDGEVVETWLAEVSA